ncbi:response regulator transcription factor [Azospirillum isscasi]|uniref:Helix-turn-helix transcriptional regulator n=1 Tax=Azospirillum isscasi TaxID=3053926 RepID=A0ABU0WR28_9PROT|nr:helix-turn-helix transcriptional regulator [Azospirillum isscasi]MDQ2106701.1 helix-turn-helix transcriptional regulator [Azospirillum isscasi]
MGDEENALVLTAREKQCLAYLAQGLRCRAMASAMGITVKTVEKQIESARRKVGAKTREQAVAIAVAKRLV